MNFTLLTRTKWDEAPRARHQVAVALSKNHTVHFIEANVAGYPNLSYQPVTKNLNRYLPSFFLKNKFRFRLPFFNEVYQKWLISEVAKKRYIDENSTLIVFDHTVHLFAKYWSGKKIYYCNDDHIRSYGIPFINTYFQYSEKRLAEYVDYIIVTSDALKDKFSQHNGKVYQIKLGAPNVEQETELTFSKNQNIKVAFVGFLSKTNDLKVFLKLLSEGVDINLFGSIKSAEVEKFIKHKNFHYHGVVTGNDLYKELNKCDVGIAPYSKKEVNSGGTPNKLWLYLAVGLPVVVTNLSTIKKWTFPDRSVYRSEDNSDFSELVNFAYQENSVELFNSRIEFARINSWDSRMADFIEIIKSNEPTHPTA